jgi:hypothetical protein
MTRRDDRFPDMFPSTQVDAAIEQVLQGGTVDDDGAPVASFVDDLRVMADGPPPTPTPELAALLAGHAVAANAASATPASLSPREPHRVEARSTRPRSGPSRAAGIRLRVAALGLAGKAAVSLALAATVAAGGASGILPEPASDFVRRAIEIVTPFELPNHASEDTGRSAHAKSNADVTPGEEKREAPLPQPGPQPAGTVREAAAIDVRSPDLEAPADTEPPPPTTDASSWARPHPTKSASPAPGPKPATPPSTLPNSDDPASGPPPHAGPPSKPEAGPQGDHVPPGRPPASAPKPGSPQLGEPPPKHESPGSPAGPPAGHGGQGSHGPPVTSDGPDQEPSGGPARGEDSSCGRSPRGGPDRAPCGEVWSSTEAPTRPSPTPCGQLPTAPPPNSSPGGRSTAPAASACRSLTTAAVGAFGVQGEIEESAGDLLAAPRQGGEDLAG